MRKIPFIIIAATLAVLGLGTYWWYQSISPGIPIPSEKEIATRYAEVHGQPGQFPPSSPVLPAIDVKHDLRLAIGGLGLGDEGENQKLGDLVTVKLAGAPGLDLVERRALAVILQELNLSWSGFVRAKDAVRAGKLLKADWFLLGTEAKINGTNSIVARVVDAHSGVMWNAGVFAADKPITQLAADLAAFLRESRQNASHPQPRVFLAIGAFQDLSVNSRQADFPRQLRGYLTAAYRGSSVTLLEREYVETLLREVRLDLAGLTEESASNPPPALQSAYWLVSGQYQSYETTNFQVELNLEIQRAFGKSWQRVVRGLPGEPIGREAKAAIDEAMSRNPGLIVATRRTEARMQLELGRELSGNQGGYNLVWVSDYWSEDPQVADKHKRKLEDAIRAFQTVLLLEPTNREAKIWLAACFRHFTILRTDEARNLYREVLEEPVQDKWVTVAQQALVQSFRLSNPEEKKRWFSAARLENTNSALDEFYRQNTNLAARDAAINSRDENSPGLAQKRLLEMVRSSKDFLDHKGGTLYGDYGLYEFQDAFPDNASAARAMADLLPTLEKTFPELAPHLTADVLSFQMDTNTTALPEFEKTLNWCIAHPKEVFQPGHYWSESAGSAFQWLTGHEQYALAVKTMEAWRVAVNQDGMEHFGDENQLALGYAYMGAERWHSALDIFDSFTNKIVRPTRNGLWGNAFEPVLTDRMAAFCRKKLGLVVADNPRKFDFGKPVLHLGSTSTFVADDRGVWVVVDGRLMHLDFDLRTNLTVQLPIDSWVPITSIYPASSSIWIGTRGAGIIEFNKVSHQCRQLTEANGLMMNDLSSLQVVGDSLWIGYGGATGGGLGRLDIRSQKLTSFMPSLNSSSTSHAGEDPPHNSIKNIAVGTDGDLLMWGDYAVRQFDVARGIWGTLPNQVGGWLRSFAADSGHLIEGGDINLLEVEISSKPTRNAPTNQITKTKLVVSTTELGRLEASFKTNANYQWISSRSFGGIRPKGTLAIQNLRDHQWQHLEDADGLPNPPTTLTLAGNDLWVGGEGAIALVDLKECKVRKFCHVKAKTVDRIQIGGGYVWAQFGEHLYRMPLSALQ